VSQRSRKGRRIDGILVIDKPTGMTSNAVLQRIKRHLGAAKAGHTGSLDPLATGVLPLCFGEATKFSQWLLDADKAYRAEGKLGAITDTGDSDGQTVATHDLPEGLDEAMLQRALEPLRGEIDQVPPMYSALKHKGQPLYKLARAGHEVERKARRVTIKALSLVSFTGDRFEIDVLCTKGTYVRSLVESIGENLGCGAHITALRRTAAASFSLADAVPMSALEDMHTGGDLDTWLQPVDKSLEALPALCINPEHCVSILNGQPVRIPGQSNPGQVRLYSCDVASSGDAATESTGGTCTGKKYSGGERPDGVFLGLGEILLDGQVKPRRLVNTATSA